MCLFIAINFSEETKNKLISLREELRSKSQRGNFSRNENIHLTLVFIGEVSPKKADKIKAILDTVTIEPFEVSIDRLGTFSRGTLWWAGLREDRKLMDLQHKLTGELTAAGFQLDKRKYSPHVTLGREVVTDLKPWQIDPFSETVTSIELMKSERLKGKLIYTVMN